MDDKKTFFNWHDYIRILEPDARHAQTLAHLVSTIAQTPDGQALIRKAYEVSGSGKNKIEIATTNKHFTFRGNMPGKTPDWGSPGSGDVIGTEDNYEGKLVLALEPMQNKHGQFYLNGYFVQQGNAILEVAASKTHTLVHEMFHLADPHYLPHVRIAEHKSSGSVVGEDHFPLPDTLKHDPRDIVFYLQKYPRHEEQAIDYTDRFMMKYFEGEHPRKGYGNMVSIYGKETNDKPRLPPEPKLCTIPLSDDQLPAFKADKEFPASLGTIPQLLEFVHTVTSTDKLNTVSIGSTLDIVPKPSNHLNNASVTVSIVPQNIDR